MSQLILCSLVLITVFNLICAWRLPQINLNTRLYASKADPSPTLQKTSLYTNPDVSRDVLKKLWLENDRLITVGSNGVTPSLQNSLNDFSNHHNIVKVKIASDIYPAMEITNKFMSEERISQKVDLLEVRTTGFMVRRKVELPPKQKRIRKNHIPRELRHKPRQVPEQRVAM